MQHLQEKPSRPAREPSLLHGRENVSLVCSVLVLFFFTFHALGLLAASLAVTCHRVLMLPYGVCSVWSRRERSVVLCRSMILSALK